MKYKKTFYSVVFKPILDKIFALVFLLLLSPFFLLTALLIKLSSRGPVFFRQRRVGKGQKIFSIFKFRTMKTDTAFDIKNPVVGNNSKNLTGIGRLLRRFKLDELPQLINVLKGDMSFVGPRPFVEEYLEYYEDWEKVKFEVKPGLTGWSQVHGNGHLPLLSRSYYDVEYLKKIHIWTDAAIIFKSFLVVFFGEERFCRPATEEQLNIYRNLAVQQAPLYLAQTQVAEKKGKR